MRRRRAAMLAMLPMLLVASCGPAGVVRPGAPEALPAHASRAIDTTPKERRRMVPPEVYLRAYLAWFGGLAPLEVQSRAKPRGMFDTWDDYLAALGLPDYKLDLPRQTQSNTLMLATLGRLGEALCVRAVERDRKAVPEARVVFAFALTADDFEAKLDALHRLFLGYPVALAPEGRVARFGELYRQVAARHAGAKGPLTADETAWAAICAALVQHPEAQLY